MSSVCIHIHNAPEACENTKLFPVLIDLSRKQVMVLSDGQSDEKTVLEIARRLRPCTGSLRIFAPAASEPLLQASSDMGISLIRKEHTREDLYGADVVICAARSQAMKDDVFAVCRTLGIRLCILSEPARSDFLLEGL